MPSASARSFFEDSVTVLIGRASVLVLSLATSVVSARLLGPQGKGLLATLLVYPVMIVSLVEMGLRQSTVYELGRASSSPGAILGTVLMFFVATSTIGVLIAVVLLTVFGNAEFTPVLVLAAAALIPIQLMSKYSGGILLGRQDIKGFNRISWLSPFSHLLFLLILVWMLGWGVAGAAFAVNVGYAVVGIYAVILVARKAPGSVWPDLRLAGRMVRLGIVYAMALFVLSLNYRIDVVMLNHLADAAAVGYYSVGVSLAELIWQLPAALGLIVFARSASASDADSFSGKVTKLFRVCLVAGALISIAFVLFGELLITLVYGEPFRPSAAALVLLLPGILAMTLHKVLNTDLAGRGKPYIALFSFLPALGVNIGLNLYWIPAYGFRGAALASTVSYLFAVSLFVVQYSRLTGIRIRRIFAFQTMDFDFFASAYRRYRRTREAGNR